MKELSTSELKLIKEELTNTINNIEHHIKIADNLSVARILTKKGDTILLELKERVQNIKKIITKIDEYCK